ncbi:unnamed protein product [Peronospora belbahrii]|uniref:glucan endo-1,3-beta-D-glucosidase n=1 Tax=Peronospora belbahrii TaxID=622444 RepID=A0AAU9L5X6_9STRA|nr:unnamed protein product [Peronospora belbahrii]CAH0521408.1 unnamed protein product [Peronospora belbahrii]
MVNVIHTTSAVAMAAAIFGMANADNFKCAGINYNIRAGPDWATPDVKCKPASQIITELATLKGATDVIRLYSLTDCDQATALVPLAINIGLKLELGIWVDSNTSSFEAEKDAFKALLQTGHVTADNIVGIHVGSEAVYRGDVTVSLAISNLEQIRALCRANPATANIPLTIADIGDTYSAYPELIEAVDYVSANYFPFWEEVDIDTAVDHFYKRYSALAQIALTRGKEVIIGETGWASNGTCANSSVATEANAAKFFYDFYKLAVEKNLVYYYFSAFDEPWKLHTLEANETVEAYFGLFTHNGILKDTIATKFDSISASIDSSSSPITTTTLPSVSDSATYQDDTGADKTSVDSTTQQDSHTMTSTSLPHKECAM